MGRNLEDLVVDNELFKTWLIYLAIFSIAMIVEAVIYGRFKNPFLEEIIKEFKGSVPTSLNPLLLFALIFFHNFIVATIALILSPTFIIPAAMLAINGAIVGYVISYSFSKLGIAGSIIGLIPHGGIEAPAVALAAASGIIIKRGFRSFIFSAATISIVVYVLLLVAAFTESVITSSLLLFTLWVK